MATGQANLRTVGQLREALAQYSDDLPIALMDLAVMGTCQHFNIVGLPTEIHEDRKDKPIQLVALTFDSTDDVHYEHPIDEYKIDWSISNVNGHT